MTDRPYLLVDVDGVLNPSFSAAVRKRLAWHEGWVRRRVDIGGLRYPLFVSPAHGPLLRSLAAETGAELAWASTWADDANRYVGPLVGLPPLPVAPCGGCGPCRAHASGPGAPLDCPDCKPKAPVIVPWTAGRPFVWLDDEPDATEACVRIAGDQPHLVVQVDEREGLTEAHLSIAREWLLALPAQPEEASHMLPPVESAQPREEKQ